MDSQDTFVIFITGFRQRGGAPGNGIDRIAGSVHRAYASESFWISEHEWSDDFWPVAARIASRSEGNPKIVVIAYSWGVGHGAMSLADSLLHFGLTIDTLYSIDGVYRSGWISGKWRSLLTHDAWFAPSIRIPANIRQVVYWRQNETLPQGHKLIAVNPAKTVLIPGEGKDGLVPNQRHQTIDNLQSVSARIMRDLYL